VRSLGCRCDDVRGQYFQCVVKDQFRVLHAIRLHDWIFLKIVKIVITS